MDLGLTEYEAGFIDRYFRSVPCRSWRI